MTNKELEQLLSSTLKPIVNTIAAMQLQIATMSQQSQQSDVPETVPAVSPERKKMRQLIKTRVKANRDNVLASQQSAPKQTSPKQTRKSVPVEASPRPTVKRVIDPTDFELAVEQARDIVLRNTRNRKNMPFNEKMTVLIENDPRPFLGKDAWQFRKAYRSAGISYRDAAVALAESLDESGWSYPA